LPSVVVGKLCNKLLDLSSQGLDDVLLLLHLGLQFGNLQLGMLRLQLGNLLLQLKLKIGNLLLQLGNLLLK
jgi:hypothetical protein